jgi:hypothetical protein
MKFACSGRDRRAKYRQPKQIAGLSSECRALAASFVVDALEPRLLASVTPTQVPISSTALLAAGEASPSSVPALHSRAGAPATLYLDFDGEPAEAWGFQQIPATPAFDTDGDPTSFSSGELSSIAAIWARVAEAYAPFNVDVTTVDPDPVNHVYADHQAVRVVIGGDGSWTGVAAGGISYTGAFTDFLQPNTGYAFSSNLGGNVAWIAESAMHEAGHMFGLSHQSDYSGSTKTSEYNVGDSSLAPIMGETYWSARGTWWYGQTTTATTYQDDMSVIASANNGFGYRADDHGNSIASADALSLSGTTFTGSGVIETTSDLDSFSFSTSSGSVSFTAAVGSYVLAQTGSSSGATLDLKLELRDAAGNLITSADTASLGETVTANLAAGTYYLVVASHGNYGDVGTYSISGTAPQGDTPMVADNEELAPVSTVRGTTDSSRTTDALARLPRTGERAAAPKRPPSNFFSPQLPLKHKKVHSHVFLDSFDSD